MLKPPRLAVRRRHVGIAGGQKRVDSSCVFHMSPCRAAQWGIRFGLLRSEMSFLHDHHSEEGGIIARTLWALNDPDYDREGTEITPIHCSTSLRGTVEGGGGDRSVL